VNPPAYDDKRGLAVAALVLGILGLMLGSFICSLLGVIFGASARKSSRSGMAIAGLVLGVIGIPWAIFFKIVTLGCGLITF
jgi:hypothetical protein